MIFALSQLLILMWVTASAAADPGDRDPAFGARGFATTAIGSTSEPVLRDMVRLDDGTLLVAGGSKAGAPGVLARYLSDGALDPSFGDGDGIALTPDSIWAGVDVQSTGKIIAFGRSGTEAAVARFTPDGRLDLGFGTGGIMTLETRSLFHDLPTYVETTGPGVDSEDRIVASIALGGCSIDGSGGETALGRDLCGNIGLFRLGPDGSPDPAFGDGDGLEIVAAGPTHNRVEMAPDDTLTIAGSYSREEEDRDGYQYYGWSWVKRLQADGSPMAEFGSRGWVTPETFVDQPPRFVLTEADGRVTVANDGRVTRYLSDGSLDTAFGADGSTFTGGLPYGSGGPNRGSDAAYDSQGRLFVAGSGSLKGRTLGILRFYPDGEIDPTFSNDGAAWYPAGSRFTGDQNRTRRGLLDASLALDDQGRPIVAGTGRGGEGLDFRIGRFLTGEGQRLSCKGEPATVQFSEGDAVTGAGQVTVTGAGNDVINRVGFNGPDALVCSGPGDDRIAGGLASDGGARIYSGAGDDNIKLVQSPGTINSGAGDDQIQLTETVRGRVNAGKGDDRVEMIRGTADVYAGPGDDRVAGSKRRLNGGIDRYFGGSGDDLLMGGTGTDRLFGGRGNDRLVGDSNDDRILGQAGNDRLFGGLGLDILIGGPGRDVAKDSRFGPPRTLYRSAGSKSALTLEFQREKLIRGSITVPFRCTNGRGGIRTSGKLLKAVDYSHRGGRVRWNNAGFTYFGWDSRSKLRGRVTDGRVRIAITASGYTYDRQGNRTRCWSGKGEKRQWLKFEAFRRPDPRQIVRP